MIENRWSAELRRLHVLAKTELDRRAINVCDAWISWADAFDIAPPADKVQLLANADPAAAGPIVRQITLKLAATCPIQMPMAVPVELAGLLDGTADVERSRPIADYERGPKPP